MTEYRWIRTNIISGYGPITQAYGICFDIKGRILICRKPDKDWSLPGGKPENKETLIEALVRELMEEVDIKVDKIHLLGVQEVDNTYFQARFVAEIKEMLNPSIDPDTGLQYERKLVYPKEIGKFILWGDRGKVMFEQAVELFEAMK